MKLNEQSLYCLLLPIFCVGLIGCGTIPSYEELGNGYVEATYTRTSWEQPAMRTELRYKKGWKTINVWPETLGVHVMNDTALFSGYAAPHNSNPANPNYTELRIFVVKSPELPMDITGEVIQRWAKEAGQDTTNINPDTIVHLNEKDHEVEFSFTTDIAGSRQGVVYKLTWPQISDIMREVKEKGAVRKDRVWGTSYIEKEFKPTP